MLETDLLLDRLRLKRSLTFWRIAAVVAATLALLFIVRPGSPITRHIARVNVTGVITEDRKLLEALAKLVKDSSVPAVIVSIDSPGGSVAGGESLHAALTRLAAAKPVVAVMRGTAASAGYMAALPAARIFARDSTLTGSIGVILQTGEVSGLLDRLGVGAEAITSGPLKDQPSFTRPLTPEGRDYLRGLVDDMYGQFVSMVAAGRRLDPARVRELADGRAYTGRQARELGLVDEAGGETEARAWLARERGVPESVDVQDLKVGGFDDQAVSAALSGLWQYWLGQAPAPANGWAIWQGGRAS